MAVGKRGRLVWILLSVVWTAGYLFLHGGDIAFFLGYHHKLFTTYPTIAESFAAKRRDNRLSRICDAAFAHACSDLPSGSRPDQACAGRYLAEVTDSFSRNGFPSQHPEACEFFRGMTVPFINWWSILVLILPVCLPPVYWKYRRVMPRS